MTCIHCADIEVKLAAAIKERDEALEAFREDNQDLGKALLEVERLNGVISEVTSERDMNGKLCDAAQERNSKLLEEVAALKLANVKVCAKHEELADYAVTLAEAWNNTVFRFHDHAKFDGASYILGESSWDWVKAPMDAALAKNPAQPAHGSLSSVQTGAQPERDALETGPQPTPVTIDIHKALIFYADKKNWAPVAEYSDGYWYMAGRPWMKAYAALKDNGLPLEPAERLETGRDPVAHQRSRIELFRHDAAAGASEVASALAPVLAPQGYSIFVTEDGIYEWENDHWCIRIECIADEPTPALREAVKLHEELRRQSGQQPAPMPERIAMMIGCLRHGEQADPDGVMVTVSRQACEEAADLIERGYAHQVSDWRPTVGAPAWYSVAGRWVLVESLFRTEARVTPASGIWCMANLNDLHASPACLVAGNKS